MILCVCVCVCKSCFGSHYLDSPGQIVVIFYNCFIILEAWYEEYVLGAKEHVLGVINSFSLLGRMQVSCHHCFIVLGQVSCSCCMALLPAG